MRLKKDLKFRLRIRLLPPSHGVLKLKPILTVEKILKFEKCDDSHFVIVRTEDESVFVGGKDKLLSKYDRHFNLIDSINLKSYL